ncbi:MAG: glutamate-5-semialdehyde dehydrogenase [Planctomycetaceae bacterium]|nr:glutamate-5-semialdehyde dehydrogenase [Planctomycetaceae bacterium]
MSASVTSNLQEYTSRVARQAAAATTPLVTASGQQKIDWMHETADALHSRRDEILTANAADLRMAPDYGLSDAMIDRLRLDESRLQAIASAVRQIALLPEPIGEVIESSVRPNGLLVSRVRVPLGVVFFIYESRPNVTIDAAALCVKSGNAVILRGGKEAFHSNQAFHRILADSLSHVGLPEHAVQMVATTDREAVGHFLKLNKLINVTIPRGGKDLIERVAREATMPVIKHFDGNCHVYLHASADPAMAKAITINSKCHRVGVCNAAESLLIDESLAPRLLPELLSALVDLGVEIRGCEQTRSLFPAALPATEADYAAEFLALILSVKVVRGLDEAITHINTYGSQHTDAIVTRDLPAAERFSREVDSAAVMVNASTRFNDGGEFGLGAEIGISTDKLHARGPCGLKELTSYKYVVHGNGQVRK